MRYHVSIIKQFMSMFQVAEQHCRKTYIYCLDQEYEKLLPLKSAKVRILHNSIRSNCTEWPPFPITLNSLRIFYTIFVRILCVKGTRFCEMYGISPLHLPVLCEIIIALHYNTRIILIPCLTQMHRNCN